MLLLRQAQLEGELRRQRHHLLGVEARLRHIAQEDEMPTDDIVIKQIPPSACRNLRHRTGMGPGGHRARGAAGGRGISGAAAAGHYRVLPAIEAAAAVRGGPAASIYPMIYQDLVAWVQAHGNQPHRPERDIWLHEVDDVSKADQQVFEAQLALPARQPAPDPTQQWPRLVIRPGG